MTSIDSLLNNVDDFCYLAIEIIQVLKALLV